MNKSVCTIHVYVISLFCILLLLLFGYNSIVSVSVKPVVELCIFVVSYFFIRLCCFFFYLFNSIAVKCYVAIGILVKDIGYVASILVLAWHYALFRNVQRKRVYYTAIVVTKQYTLIHKYN